MFKKLIRLLFGREDISRSSKTKANIALLICFHAFNVFLNMAIVPLSLHYLGVLKYGIWVTISSIVIWLGYLDFGIGNGLRNKVSETIARNDFGKARAYVSTAYMIFSIGAGIVVLILVSISRFINWIKVLNAPETLRGEIDLLMQFLFVLFICQLLLKLVNAIINGDQKPALNGLISLLINFFTIIGIYGLFMVKTDSLISFGVVFLFVPVLVLLAISAIIFKTVYKNISPSIKYVDYKLSKDLLNLGIQFFIIQISGLVIFATQNLIITQLLGPAEVTVYNIAYRYFTLITMVFGVLIAPFWSAFTDAYVKHDIQWIQKAIRKITLLWGGLSVITVLMVVCSTVFYRFWVGGAIKIPFILSAAMGIFVIISNWNNIFAYFLNGASKIRLQLYVSIGTALVDIPLSIYLVKYMKMGTTGIIVTASGLLFISSVLGPIQYRKIITGTAKGIWNK